MTATGRAALAERWSMVHGGTKATRRSPIGATRSTLEMTGRQASGPDVVDLREPETGTSTVARSLTDFVFDRGGAGSVPLSRQPAFIDGVTGRTWSHREIAEGAHRVAGGLQRAGFSPGQVLGIMAPNVPEYALAFHGALIAGGTVTVVDPAAGPDEVQRQMNDAGVSHLVSTPDTISTVTRSLGSTPVERWFVISGAEGRTPFESLLDADPIDQVPIEPERTVAALPYSSGVRGLPKGVMLTHSCLTANLAQLEEMFPVENDESTVAVLPFFHAFGMTVILNGVLRRSGRAVTMPRFHFESFLEQIERHRATRIYVVPTIVMGLAVHPAVDRFDLSSLRQVMSGGAPLAADLAAAASDRLGCEVTQGFGLTEASPVTHTTPLGRHRGGSAGYALPGTETRIVDLESRRDLEPGQVGELHVRGPQVMKGYWRDAKATLEVLDGDGWLRTGDLARVDDDGRLYVVGRHKEIFKCKGAQVAPLELESILVEHPEVIDAAVTPSPDPLAGDIPVALIVASRAEVDTEDIRRFVAHRVSRHKRIRKIVVVDRIPRRRNRTIDRDRVAALVA